MGDSFLGPIGDIPPGVGELPGPFLGPLCKKAPGVRPNPSGSTVIGLPPFTPSTGASGAKGFGFAGAVGVSRGTLRAPDGTATACDSAGPIAGGVSPWPRAIDSSSSARNACSAPGPAPLAVSCSSSSFAALTRSEGFAPLSRSVSRNTLKASCRSVSLVTCRPSCMANRSAERSNAARNAQLARRPYLCKR